MAEQRPAGDDLERALSDLAPRLAYPPTPDARAAVRARLGDGQRRGRVARWSGRRVVFAVAVLLLAAALAALALPGARAAVAEWLDLPGVAVRSTPRDPVPAAIPAGSGLVLGEAQSLAEARAAVLFRVRTPAALGAPDTVYVSPTPPGGLVTLVYKPRRELPEAAETGVGLLLLQFRGALLPQFIQKGLGPGARLTPVQVEGERGWWISGAPHSVIFQDADGRTGDDPARLAANTLLWARDGITYRLETALELAEALQIVASLR